MFRLQTDQPKPSLPKNKKKIKNHRNKYKIKTTNYNLNAPYRSAADNTETIIQLTGCFGSLVTMSTDRHTTIKRQPFRIYHAAVD